jgi:hypothetical protein
MNRFSFVRFAALAAAPVLLLTLAAAPPASHATVSTSAATAGADLSLTLTLAPYQGNPNTCGTATELEATTGDQVLLCYTLTNNGTTTLTHQSLEDSLDGTILAYEPITLAPGQTHRRVRTIVAVGDTQRTATWRGYAALPRYSYADTGASGFVDIAGTGTRIGFDAAPDLAPFTSAFPLRFYGRTSSALCVSNDGVVLFDDPACLSPQSGSTPDYGYAYNEPLPVTVGFGRVLVPTVIAPMWSDLDREPGGVYAQTLGTAPNRRLIVQWNDLGTSIASTTTARFQVIFEESSDTIRFEYAATAFGNEADHGAFATIGLQGDPAGLYTQYSFREPSLAPGRSIVWTYTPEVGGTAAGNTVRVDAGIPEIAVAPAALSAVAGPGESVTRTLSIDNVGARDLTWNLGEAPGGTTAHFPRTPRHIAPPIGNAAEATPNSLASTFAGALRLPWLPGHRPLAPNGSLPFFGTSPIAGFLGFDGADPTGTFSIINPDVDTWYFGTQFIGNDFSKLYAIVYDSWTYPPGTYGTLDVATGAFTQLGHITGGDSWTWSGLTQDPLTGTVYAINSNDGLFAKLYTIDLASGRATKVGDITGPGLNPPYSIHTLAISPGGLMYGIDLYGQMFVAIDKLTGQARPIETLGLQLAGFQDLEFDQQTGVLYYSAAYVNSSGVTVGELRRMDPLSGLSTPIGSYPPTGGFPGTQVGTIALAKPTVGCAAPGEVPWLSATPTSGSIAAGAPGQPVTVTFDGAGLAPGRYEASICVHSTDPRKPDVAVPVSFVVSDAVLYDQSVADTSLRAFNNTVVAPVVVTGMSSEGADDFVVTAAEGWRVSGFNFTAYSVSGTFPSHVNLRVHADDGSGHPGEEIVCLAPRVPAFVLDQPANQIGVWLDAPCVLDAGTYWVVWSFADVDVSSPVLGLWGQTTVQHHQPAVWRNPGGQLSAACMAWSTFAQCPDQFDPSARDFGFSVYGRVFDVCEDTLFADGFETTSGACRAAPRD